MNKAKEKKKLLTLFSLKEINVLINREFANFTIGFNNNILYINLVNKENKCYESTFSLEQIRNSISMPINEMQNAFIWLYSRINLNQYYLRYNENRTEVIFEYNDFNGYANILEPKKLILILKTNEENIFEIKNKEILKLIEDFNIKYSCDINASDGLFLQLTNKNMNNQGFKELCDFNLKIHTLLLDNNKISDLTPMKNNDNFKSLQKLSLFENNINDIKPLSNSFLDNLKELRLSHNKINDISALEGAKMNKIEILFLDNNNISDIKSFEK